MSSLDTIHEFCLEFTMGATFWDLALIGLGLTGIEEVSEVRSSACISQLLSSVLHSIDAFDMRGSSDCRPSPTIFGLSDEMVFFSFLGNRSWNYYIGLKWSGPIFLVLFPFLIPCQFLRHGAAVTVELNHWHRILPAQEEPDGGVGPLLQHLN